MDEINHPEHYTRGNIECWDAMQACMTKQQFMGYLRGNAIKYLWRCEAKQNYAQDIEKAQAYVNKLIEAYKQDM
ncbi:DUF3310 domain-containing protein [Atopobium deltae]|uniref:Protein of unknwon function n=1 Tax=Atopobium deltae TaxID=1393034 RepID=A0A133XPE6_9ACTN|nr:DUF3310 domain-containing protein [Atopobium deltae]KXB32809.1 hypothetical protein HMPREF3192_01489 [Atopobium deltae]